MPRPTLNPTDEQRKKVKALVAVGIPQEEIARQVGVRSPKTLRKHFREELDRGIVEANASVAGALYKEAINGNVAAQKFWLLFRAGWRIESRYGAGTNTPPPFVVGVTTGGPQS